MPPIPDTTQSLPGKNAPRQTGGSVAGLVAPKLEVVRLGFIGIGHRGRNMLKETLLLEGCEVGALCDVDEAALRQGSAMVVERGRAAPRTYGGKPDAYRAMLERDDLDAIMICTPWRNHVPMAVDTMRAGKHAFVEVPAAVTVEECWQLVETAEATRQHCMMMENCCYGREELMVLRMCRKGLFGDLLHGEAAYFHDLRYLTKDPAHGTGRWRMFEDTFRNGNLYPTHGLGPVAQCLGINRGDRFDHLVSFGTSARSLADYAQKHLPSGNPYKTARFVCGDMNSTMIKTARERTIVVQYDIVNPIPYSRGNVIQGTRGIFAGYPNRIAIEGRGSAHDWDMDMEKWHAEYEHPLWEKTGRLAVKVDQHGGMGHGGMDFVMKWRIIQCLREGLPLDQDVYDAAAWSAIGPLSELSVARKGEPVEVPDFTRGAWTTMPPLGVVA